MALERNPYLVRIAEVLIINGECMRSDINQLFDGDTKKSARFMTEQKKVLKVLTRKSGKVIRPQSYSLKNTQTKFVSPFEKLVKDIDPSGNAWTYYYTNYKMHSKVRTDAVYAKRKSALAATLFLMADYYDIKCWTHLPLDEIAEQKATLPINTFVNVDEIKNFKEDRRGEYAGSSATGVLVCPNGIFTCYYITRVPVIGETPESLKTEEEKTASPDKPAKKRKKASSEDGPNWKSKLESRFLQHVRQIFGTLKIDGKVEDQSSAMMDNILFVGKDEVAEAFCYGFNHPNSKKAYVLSSTVYKIIYIPDTEIGKQLLYLMSIPDYQECIKEYIFRNQRRVKSRTEDGYLDDLPTVVWLDGDLRRLSEVLALERDKIQICCLEGQTEIIEKIAAMHKKSEVYVLEIEYDNILKVLKKGGKL